MTNREKLLHTNLYDLLCRMNERLRDNEGKNENDESRACIMDCFMESSESERRCFANCEKCIASYLNERSELWTKST
ncbi:MAG: hypothetical protein IJH64_00840 [Oscillospiraceae bacterium]|nr:hypothetical protein [Oscillospiraceae bacterium]